MAFQSIGNHMAPACGNEVVLVDSANYQMFLVGGQETGFAKREVAGKRNVPATSAGTTIASNGRATRLGHILGLVVSPRSCDIYFTERVRDQLSNPLRHLRPHTSPATPYRALEPSAAPLLLGRRSVSRQRW